MLRAGEKVESIEKSLTRHSGRFPLFNDPAIIIHDKSSDHRIARTNVLRLGAGGRAVVGAAAGRCDRRTCLVFTHGEAAGILAVVDGAIGAIIGVLPATTPSIAPPQ